MGGGVGSTLRPNRIGPAAGAATYSPGAAPSSKLGGGSRAGAGASLNEATFAAASPTLGDAPRGTAFFGVGLC